MLENHKIAVGLLTIGGIAVAVGLFGKYVFHVPGTRLSIAKIKSNCMTYKLQEDEASAKAAVLSRDKFNSCEQWWKDNMLANIGVAPGVNANDLTDQQWQALVSNINIYQQKLTAQYDFSILIHKYPDALAFWLNEMPGVTSSKTAFDFILKHY